MLPHDPYTLMLNALNDHMDNISEEEVWLGLQKSQDFVRQLRNGYQSCPCNIDYGNAHLRAAYMLAYYPHYVEVLYAVLKQLHEEDVNLLSIDVLRIACVGAGPAPELLGLLSFLQEQNPGEQIVKACVLDKYANDWRVGQEITRYHLAPQYGQHKQLFLNPIHFDLTTPPDTWADLVFRPLKRANMFVMQNALNDQLAMRESLLANLLFIIQQSKPDTLFVLIDLVYAEIKAFLNDLADLVTDEQIARVVLRPSDANVIESKVKVPEIVLEHLLVGEDGLIPRRYTRFYSLSFVRI
jgi:hypothetical protein